MHRDSFPAVRDRLVGLAPGSFVSADVLICKIYRHVKNGVIVSLHVIFNEVIPDPTADYFARLERLKIEVDPADFQF